MQHDWKHVERPGGSHTALDGKKSLRGTLPLPQKCWVCGWAFRNDHRNRPQEQFEPFGAEERLHRTLRVETIANSAGGTAQVSIVAQPSIGFLNTKYYSNGSPTEDTEDCLGRITVGLTRSKSLTLVVSPLDMMRLMGMTQWSRP